LMEEGLNGFLIMHIKYEKKPIKFISGFDQMHLEKMIVL
jgi:hypothetical protein